MLRGFVSWWRERHGQLRGASKTNVAFGPAALHHRFLSIHPFVDANGRVARVLLDQAARELLSLGVTQELVANQQLYFSSLVAADRGDLQPLARLIGASLQ